jgi:cellulose synthase (UDP-forming)
MAVVARGVRSARPATAPKHRKTSTPPEPSPPDKPGSSDKSGATRQQDTPAAPDATLELPAVDQPDALERLTTPAKPGTSTRPRPDTRDQRAAPAHPDTTEWFTPAKPGSPDRPAAPAKPEAQERLSAPGQPDPLPRPATPGKPEARDWFTPAPAQPGTATLPQPETRERPAAPSRPDPLTAPASRPGPTAPAQPDPLTAPAKPETNGRPKQDARTRPATPDLLDPLTTLAKPGTNGRPKQDARTRPAAPAKPEPLTTPAKPDTNGRPKQDALDQLTAPAQPDRRDQTRPDPADRAAPGRRATRNRAARPSESAASRGQAATTHRRAAREAGDDAPNPVLPVPPKDHEKWTYIRRHMWVLTLCSALSFPPLVYSQYRMVENSPWFLIYAPFALFGIMTFLLSMVVDGMSRSFDLAEHKRIVAGWLPLWYPSVDVFLPVCGEPIEVLRNAWNHVAVLRNRYPGQVTPYVLDDSADPKLKAMARRFGFAYATRPDRGWFKKSGNLRYGFSISNGDYILLLDADFAPRADLLDETIPYLDMFPDIGIVQTPQFFRVLDEQTWVERGAGAIQELFYRSIQTARAKKGGAICVGSCAVYRRSALEQNKGMSLAEHSEDLHTGFDLYRLGYKLRYLPIALSTGVCPDNILAFLNQQYRWCSGTMSLMRDKKFWKTKLPLYMRLCYLTGLVGYVYTAVFTFVAPALAIGMLLFVPGQLLMRNLIFIAPVLFYAGVIYPMWHRAPYRLEAWSVRVISGWAHLFAFTDMLRGRLRGWQPSGSGSKRQDGRRRLWIGLIGWSAGSAALWVGLALWRMMTMNPYNFFLIFVLGLFQLVVVGRILIQPRAGAT